MKAEDSLPKKEWWISTIMNNCLQKTLFCVGIIWSIMLSILSLFVVNSCLCTFYCELYSCCYCGCCWETYICLTWIGWCCTNCCFCSEHDCVCISWIWLLLIFVVVAALVIIADLFVWRMTFLVEIGVKPKTVFNCSFDLKHVNNMSADELILS